MSTTIQWPGTLAEAIDYFSDPDLALAYAVRLRWPDGPVCPRCGGTDHGYLKTRGLWRCRACKKQYSVKLGTIFEGSQLGLEKWLPAIWLVANPQSNTSSHELARLLGITQKSAWFMLYRIKRAARAHDEGA